MFKTDKENYEKYWDDISPFIKFGCLKDEKFGDKIKGSILYKNLEHKYLTLEEYIENVKNQASDAEDVEVVENAEIADADSTSEEKAAEEVKTDAEEKAAEEVKSDDAESTDAEAVEAEVVEDSKEEEKKEPLNVYYVTDEQQQSQYIKMFKEQGQDAVILTHNIDSAFITYLEQHNEEIRFQRIDAEVHDSLRDEVEEGDKEEFKKLSDELVELFRKELNNEKLEVKVEKLKDNSVASMAVLSEQSRRMEEMMRMYSMGGSMHKSLKMFMFCGVSTMVWGILFGGYFGNVVDIVSEVFFGHKVVIPALWFIPLNDPMRLLVYSLAFGVVHLFVGLGIKGYMELKDGRVLDFFCDVVLWFAFLIGLILMLLPTDIFASIAQTQIVFPPVSPAL